MIRLVWPTKFIEKFSVRCIFFNLFFISSLTLPIVSTSQTWVPIHSRFSTGDTAFRHWDAIFVAKDIGWYINGGFPMKIYKTSDGGLNYNLQKQFTGQLLQPFAFDTLHVWIRNERYGYHWIVFSNDGGTTWDSTYIDNYFVGYGPFYFFTPSDGLLFGSNLLSTSDGGRAWTSINCKDSTLVEVASEAKFINRKTGFIIGPYPTGSDAGFLGGTTDSGKTWQYKTIPTDISPMSALDFSDSLHGIAVGSGSFSSTGIIYSTKNGGNSWNFQYKVQAGIFYDVGFLDSLTGWITGPNGSIWHTTDGGTNWNFEQAPVTVNLKRISVLRKDKIVYVVGDSGIVLRADVSTAVEEISPNLPKTAILYQNYPNPFNPSTMIRFSIKKPEIINVRVFDLLGREVTTLISERVSPGTYSVPWDATAMSSGIYFVRLSAGRYWVGTRKMLLMK